MQLPHFREPTSGFTHLAGAVLSLVGLLWLVAVAWSDPPRVITLVIYGLSMVILYIASAVYHLTPGSPRVLNILVRFDRVSIFLLIAGTYTPLVYYYLQGTWRWSLLGIVWGIAFVGSVYTLFLYKRGKSNKLWMTLIYVSMGCVGLIAAPRLASMLPVGASVLILTGGLVYILGAVVYTMKRPNLHRYFNFHDLWHIFVMVASALFFTAILFFVAMA